jgi:hypothetical protein
MTLNKTEYSVGEPINVTLTITNTSNQTLNFYYSAWSFDFLVYNATNKNIYQWSSFQVFPQFIADLQFSPGESLTRVLVWPQTCNKTMSSEGIPVSPGTYYIVGLASSPKLQTAPIQVTIVKP